MPIAGSAFDALRAIRPQLPIESTPAAERSQGVGCRILTGNFADVLTELLWSILRYASKNPLLRWRPGLSMRQLPDTFLAIRCH
jgi:hypothetical protein